jgi:transcriptional regulator with XRE-family HTH domain
MIFGLRLPRELSEGRLRHAKGLSQDDLAYEAEVIFRGMAHRADNVSNRETATGWENGRCSIADL